jgi:1-acyl-sn-glycerol-3-phosphate acyltransferase
MIRLRSLIFNIAFYVNLIVLMILGLPMILRGRHGVFAMARLWGSTSLWLLDKICGLRVEFRGLENIPQGGYIIAAKHQSILETFALLEHAPDFAYVLKRQLIFIPLFGLYLMGAQQIDIDRSRGRNAMAQISKRAGEVLAAGRQVFIFPEGTRRPPSRRFTATPARRACRWRSTPASTGVGAASRAARASPSSSTCRSSSRASPGTTCSRNCRRRSRRRATV